MHKLHWTPAFSVHVESIDTQHKALFGIINELSEAIDTKKGHVIVGSILSKLIAYTEYHFDHEENCLSVTCFEKLEKHKCEHEGLSNKVKVLEKEYSDGKEGVAEEILKTLQLWLQHHIMKSDKQYAVVLEQSGLQ